MAKQKILAKPYEVISDERDERKSQKVQLSDAQKVILEYLIKNIKIKITLI